MVREISQSALQAYRGFSHYEGIHTAIQDREARKHRLVSEAHALRRVQPKIAMVSEQEIRERMGRLAESVTRFPLQCYPAIRPMFPRKIRMMPKGKAFGGRNLYSMTGRILLNAGLATDFERLVENKKGEAGKPASPFFTCEPQRPGFTQFESGVPVWTSDKKFQFWAFCNRHL